MDAPIKLYFTENEAALDIYSKKCTSLDIEYTRTDAFVDKAAEWLNETLRNTDFYENEIELMVNEFKKAMELWNK